MRAIPALVLATFLPAAAAAQMMGGAIATSHYFPLVDGARYEYRHSGGPWATSTVTVRTGQSWAGHAGLAAMHTTYTCVVGVACAPDATDFYRMDHDGLHYFGGTGADPAGSVFSMMSFSSPEWLLKNPVMPGTMMGPGGGYANAEGWGAAVYGTGSMMGTRSYSSSYRAQAMESVTTPAGTFANALHVREDRGSGYARDVWYAPGVGIVMMSDGMQTAMLTGYAIPGAVAQPGGGAAPMPFMPFNGLWWNPAESGTGYNLQVQHGVMVATMFSYGANGEPVWYYAAGPLARMGESVMMSSTLDRYRGGQCISCAYAPATVAGNDGSFTIVFSSPNSATVQFPGGRTTRIEPQPW